jgi:hypothetical protein
MTLRDVLRNGAAAGLGMLGFALYGLGGAHISGAGGIYLLRCLACIILGVALVLFAIRLALRRQEGA